MVITADILKRELMRYYLHERQFLCVTTEQALIYGVADVWVLSKDYMGIEIEIKVSKPDLLSELNSIKHILGELSGKKDGKYRKHESYLKQATNPPYVKANLLPNRFYFCVPKNLEEFAYSTLKHTPYGLLVCSPGAHWIESTKVIKSGKLLHNEPVAKTRIQETMRRICNENLTLRSKIREVDSNNRDLREKNKQLLEID